MMPPCSIETLDTQVSEPPEYLIERFRGWKGSLVVLGAGGKMGFHLSLMLRRVFVALKQRNRVIAVSRFGDAASISRFAKSGIETLSADLTDPDQVKALPEAAAVIYLAGKKFGTSDAPDDLRLFNEVMPARVAARYAGVPIVVFSTGCVYPFVEPSSGGSTEDDPPVPAGAYAESCHGRERAFVQSSEIAQTPLSLIRLNYAVDLQYGVIVDLAQKIWNDEPVDATMGYLNCIWQGDAIAHSLASVLHASPSPNPFVLNVTGERILSVRDVAQELGQRLGKEAKVIGAEAPTAWLNNAAKSHQLFGVPRIDEDTLIDWVADWIRNERPLLGKATQFEVRDGKY